MRHAPGVAQQRSSVWKGRYGGSAMLLSAVLFVLVFGARGEAQTPTHPTGELTVFAAASLTEPFTEMGKRLEAAYPGLQILYNFGGTPTLRTQLEQGAHADVFVSA